MTKTSYFPTKFSIAALAISLGILVVSCGQSKKNSQTNSTAADAKTTPTGKEGNLALPVALDEESAEAWEILERDYRGIWGDISYLENLQKYNSLGKVEKLMVDLDIEVQIGDKMDSDEHNFWVCRINSMEPDLRRKDAYNPRLVDKDTWMLVSKETGKEQTFKCFKRGKTDYYKDYRFAINKMAFRWFSGSYTMLDPAGNTIGVFEFSEDGQIVKEYEFQRYFLGTDWDFQDYISLYIEGDDKREYLLLEYSNDQSFSVYEVEDFDSFDEPFVKKGLKFTIKRNSWNYASIFSKVVSGEILS